MTDLGEGLPRAHSEIRGDDERQITDVAYIELRQRPGLLAERLHPDENTVAPGSAHRGQARYVTDPFVIERAQVVPLARLGPKTDLPKRMVPPVLEAVVPAVVVSEPMCAASGRKRGCCRQISERPRRPTPDDEIHHERIVVGLHPDSVRFAPLAQEEPFAERVVRIEDEERLARPVGAPRHLGDDRRASGEVYLADNATGELGADDRQMPQLRPARKLPGSIEKEA